MKQASPSAFRALLGGGLFLFLSNLASAEPASALPEEARAFYAALPASEGSTHIHRTKEVGGNGGIPFEEVCPDGGVLIGFEVWEGDYSTHLVLRGIRPIFRTAAGRVVGNLHGEKSDQEPIVIEANEGYAVANLDIRGGDRVDGFKASLWHYDSYDGRLHSGDAYKLEWVGGHGGVEFHRLIPAPGRIVVGITGASGNQVDRLGLLYANP
jgi:hypothetical protein